MTRLPNLLTGLRLALALFTFFGLAGATLLSDRLTPAEQFSLERWAFWAFVVAALTDFFDGWLARRLHATSLWGAILDPIADKVLVCGVILGLLTLGPNAPVAIPAALILFREFTVSALREVAAGKGVSLPVTLLAKWKTTLQLVALGAELLVACWAAFSLPSDPAIQGPATIGAHALLWLAAVITLVTGAQYWEQARKALSAAG
ncbi:MAG TPA: CDP-diacylglycerol--glycerol-3-phosphate 3-phosphatidyltransferase [Caulobacteraceae bacterium]|jgi:CDP-diacylglycerol--glycerol-3-phosphate 3-phosphatidyltransferase|nr:CDP-diacylglycerol--glycerol-3-phosphate 3-phosphatidyltransferase [Caulobacteraceae bacterium]